MISFPCKHCDKQPCGAHHDECEEYQKILKENRASKDKLRAYSLLFARDMARRN